MYNSSKQQSNLKETDLLSSTLKRVKKLQFNKYYHFIHKYPGKATGYNGILLSSIESTVSYCLFLNSSTLEKYMNYVHPICTL